MRRTLAIVTLLLTTCSIPAQASTDARSEAGRFENPVKTEGVLLADSRDEAWDRYRDDRHRELDRQMNDEMNRPHNSRLSQKQKEQVIRDAHKALDKQLDREEKEWKERYGRSNGRYDRNNRNDRFDRDYDRNNRNNRNNRIRDSRYDSDRRYDDRTERDRDYRVDPQNPYEQYNRRRGNY